MNNTRIIRSFRLVVPVLLFLAGCYPWYPPPKTPIDALRYTMPETEHRLLIVFLPGNGDSLRTFEREGLVDAVRARKLPADMVAVDAYLSYYVNGSVFTRLKEDVIDPAKALGYRNIWIVGNSLGGFGAVSYARKYPRDVTGVVLLGPFLGEKKTIREITEAGSLDKWEPGEMPQDPREAWGWELWKWMKDAEQQKCFQDTAGRSGKGSDKCPSRIYLGYGKGDRFAAGQKLMAQILPPGQSFAIDGGHDWRTWKKAWGLILDHILSESRGI